MYSVVITPTADKFLEKLDSQARERIVKALERLQIRPHAHLERLVSEPYFKFRVGDFRAIIDLQDDKLVVLVIEIGHRKDIYKKHKNWQK